MPVKIIVIVIRCPKNNRAPKLLKLFVNHDNMNFQDCENETPTQIQDGKQGGFQIVPKANKYNSVKQLTIFVQKNFGDQITQIQQIQILGSPIFEIDVKNLKKVTKTR